jgi:hypothetical protein
MSANGAMSASVVRAALQERFCKPEWALFFEVANGTGANIRRFADAVAMNLFPSRGLEVHGFEIKVSRSDWQRELKDPNKAETIWKYCDHWWIAAPAGIVRKDELPPTWGLLELAEAKGLVNGASGKLRIAVQAPKLEPQDLTRSFVAALLRRASETDHAMVDRIVDRKLAVLRQEDRERNARTIEDRTRRMHDQLAKVADFEKQLGVSISDWNASPAQGAALKAIGAIGLDKTWGHIHGVRISLGGVLRDLDKVIADHDAAVPVEVEAAEDGEAVVGAPA